ncbi:hypothetical protein ACTA71_010708 [Dictyostelium dimigraforme]
MEGGDNSLTIIDGSEIIDPELYFESSELFINSTMKIQSLHQQFILEMLLYMQLKQCNIWQCYYIKFVKSFTSNFNFEVGTFQFNKITFQNCILSGLFYFNLIFGELNLLIKLI